jgi:hypothetical protein
LKNNAAILQLRKLKGAFMHTVVNHLYLNVPIESIRRSAEQGLLPILKDIPGFRGFNLVKAAEDHLIVILFWESLENANHGAGIIGPTWFAQNIAPHFKSEQQRSVGEVILQYQR